MLGLNTGTQLANNKDRTSWLTGQVHGVDLGPEQYVLAYTVDV